MGKIRINVLLLFFVIVFQSVSFGQIKYTIHANCGISNFIEKNNEPSVVVGNSYTYLPSYTIGGEGLYVFNNSKMGIISGLNFSLFSSENHMPDDFFSQSGSSFESPYTGEKKWNERFYSLSVPIKVNYKLEKWLHFNAGLANTFHLKNENISGQKINVYTLNFVGGFDFLIKKKFVVGAMYYRDILPSMRLLKSSPKTDTYNIKYSVQQITVKIGYIIK